jgi:hypothetical protein
MERRLFLALLLGVAAAPAAADTVNARGGLAIGGYDPVAYFAQGRARRGANMHYLDWNDARWLFVTAANRDAFAADPERYAPRYGGWCAYGMAQGYKAPIDPDAWSIVEGRLYLNSSNSVRRTWLGDVPGFLAKADAHWPAVSAAR